MDDKRFFLERFIRENPDRKIIVFVRTRVRAERVAKAMARVGITAVTLHGDKDQIERSAVMQNFKSQSSGILIATDVSARGIDIPDVRFVVNYDLPDIAENYVHRVGRTGRGFNKGSAISFCSTEERQRLDEIQQMLEKKIEVVKIGKKSYSLTIEPEAVTSPLHKLLEEAEILPRKKPKKKIKKPKKRR